LAKRIAAIDEFLIVNVATAPYPEQVEGQMSDRLSFDWHVDRGFDLAQRDREVRAKDVLAEPPTRS
jgi:hypothetical protein